jgi:hypothetical protein
LDQPEILLRQRLFGRAHGLSLLAAACLDLPAYIEADPGMPTRPGTQTGEGHRTIVRDLARHYFGPRAARRSGSTCRAP